MLVGLSEGDDAAVYELREDLAVILTVDFITPVVDDAYDYGAIAAANALSDVYAMGGEVILALNVCGFPASLTQEIVAEILRGGADQVAVAGGILAGGHTVDDGEPKFGLSVAGMISPAEVLTKRGAKAGDLVVLSKPVGTGAVTTALKNGVADPDHVSAAVAAMRELNRDASQVARRLGARACTDVSGFSLIGHANEIADRSGVGITLHHEEIPILEGARRYAAQGHLPGGTGNNRRFYEETVRFARALADPDRLLYFTPETSGGLLFAIPPEKSRALAAVCDEHSLACRIIGEVVDEKGIRVI